MFCRALSTLELKGNHEICQKDSAMWNRAAHMKKIHPKIALAKFRKHFKKRLLKYL